MSTAANVLTENKSQKPLNANPIRGGQWVSLVIMATIALGAGGTGYYLYVAKAKAALRIAEESRARLAEKDSGDAISVDTVRLTKGGIIRASTQIGTVQPFKEADLYAKVSGYLKTLNVDYGSRVRKSELLAEIDDPEIITEAEKAVADVRQARAAVEQAKAFILSAIADRDAAAVAVEKAKAEVDRFISLTTYHLKKFNRYKELVKSQALPQQLADEEEDSYESSRASQRAAEQEVLYAEAQVISAKARVTKAEADLDGAKARVEVAIAKKATADVIVGYTKITSPYDGVVTRRNFFPGAFIRSADQGNVEPILTVARIDKVRVVTLIPDIYVNLIKLGNPAEVTLDAMGAEVFKGSVSRFADSEDPTSRTMHTEIDLDNPKGRIKPGMYGIAKVIVDQAIKSSTLPASCLVGEAKGGNGELYVIKDGKARKTKVKVGLDDGIRVEILSGIAPEDDVILNTRAVADGVPVRALQR